MKNINLKSVKNNSCYLKVRENMLKYTSIKKYFVKYHKSRGDLRSTKELDYLEDANVVKIDNCDKEMLVGLVVDGFNIDEYVENRAYYPKYERFLKNNNIRYEIYNIHKSDWNEVAKKYNIILWHPDSDPVSKCEAESKIYILEKMGIICYPSFNEIYTYEDKVRAHYFFKKNSLPEIPTFISFDKKESLEYANKAAYPLVSKIAIGNASQGVEIIKNKEEAKRIIKNAFSVKGERTYWHYLRQKDYVYFQKYIDDALYDLRIIVIHNKYWGYYRYPKTGDFRASGSGRYEKKAIPKEALEIARKTKMLYKANMLATDLLYSERERKYYIIETSIFIGIDTCEQLKVNGIPGYYELDSNGNYCFKEGKYWIQEIALEYLFTNKVKYAKKNRVQ